MLVSRGAIGHTLERRLIMLNDGPQKIFLVITVPFWSWEFEKKSIYIKRSE